jgi:Bacterial protein of unknown function (HtrL_YibB)
MKEYLTINNMSFTFVTALYEIQREQHDQRSFLKYQEWFSKTLSVPLPMVIYTEEKNRHIVESIRKDLPTRTFYTSIEDAPLYYTVKDVKHILENTQFKSKIHHPNGLENKCYEYIPIINSKFKWVIDAIEENYFNTDMFFWIDAGISRFMNFDMSINQFNVSLIQELHTSNKLYFQIGKKEALNRIFETPNSIEDYVGTNTNFIMAGFFGGNKSVLLEVCKRSYRLYKHEFIDKDRIDNEQTLIGFVLPHYKHNTFFIENSPTQNYINYYIFCGRR